MFLRCLRHILWGCIVAALSFSFTFVFPSFDNPVVSSLHLQCTRAEGDVQTDRRHSVRLHANVKCNDNIICFFLCALQCHQQRTSGAIKCPPQFDVPHTTSWRSDPVIITVASICSADCSLVECVVSWPVAVTIKRHVLSHLILDTKARAAKCAERFD